MNEETDRARREGARDALIESLQREIERVEREMSEKTAQWASRVKRMEGGVIGVLVGGCYLFLKSQGIVP